MVIMMMMAVMMMMTINNYDIVAADGEYINDHDG